MAQRGGSHGYCLKWKYHPNNLLHMFNQLLLNESFTDVLVACEGKAIKCHKMVLSACSKYFEQVFCENSSYLQNSTLVILKDMKFADVQAIIEFMYQGEINVAHDQLPSLLKAAESLQVKGLADISGSNSGSNHGGASLTGGSKEDGTEYGDRDTGGEESTPGTPPSAGMEANSDGGGSLNDHPPKKKRGRPPMGMDTSLSDGMSLTVSGNPMMDSSQGFDDFPGNLLESHFALPRSKKPSKRKQTGLSTDMEPEDDMEDDGGELGAGEDDEVTEEDVQNIVKMTDYIEKGGSRPQFWEEPTTKKIMNAIRSKKMEMKAAAEILGVSYSTLYSRYRELHGYLKMPHTQDTNFNYYQVLNLLRAGQISLADAAKRLNIHEKTLGAYLSTTITPKKPKLSITPSTSGLSGDAQTFAMNLIEQANLQGTQISSLLEKQQIGYDDEDDEDSDGDMGGSQLSHHSQNSSKLPLSSHDLKQENDADGWQR